MSQQTRRRNVILEDPVMDASEMDRARAEAFREGERANDNNRRVLRYQKGILLNNPYPSGSIKHSGWSAGYQYRDMVNDG